MFSLFTLFVLIQLLPANLAIVDVSDANAKFLKCCNVIDLNQNTREHACQYPPKMDSRMEMEISAWPSKFKAYIGCYAAHKDNKKCCTDHGVTNVCQNLCDGKAPPRFPLRYMVCKKDAIGKAINECNEKAQEEAIQLLLAHREANGMVQVDGED